MVRMKSEKNKKRHNLLFLGNDGNLIYALATDRRIAIVGVVADRQKKSHIPYFGSAYDYAKKNKLPLVSQYEFNKCCRKHSENCQYDEHQKLHHC